MKLKLEELEPILPSYQLFPQVFLIAVKLARDIKKNGLKEPLVVVRCKDGHFKIIDGAHRYFALLILGFEECEVVENVLDEHGFQRDVRA